MKTTPFTETHIALGAKMHEFAGYNMPIEYSGIIDEHLTVCNAVGVFDVSHMGEFWVKGPNALEFLQQVTSNNVEKSSVPPWEKRPRQRPAPCFRGPGVSGALFLHSSFAPVKESLQGRLQRSVSDLRTKPQQR